VAAGFHFFPLSGLADPYSAYYCSYPHNYLAAAKRIQAFLITQIALKASGPASLFIYLEPTFVQGNDR
jgi:hypothetical protein